MTQNKHIPKEIKLAIIEYLSGSWEECNSTLLTTWINENKENEQLFSQLVDIWGAETIVKNEKNFDVNRAWNNLFDQVQKNDSPVKHQFNFQELYKYAAIFILALFIGGIGYSWLKTQDIFAAKQMVEVNAPYGSQSNLKLADGSIVKLNSGTTLKYNKKFGISNRDIELVGEAFFEVEKNKKLPFTVKARGVSVTALGTQFNVKAYSDEKQILTTLLEGSVRVKNLEHGEKRSILLQPNQQAIFNLEESQFLVSEIETKDNVSWFTDTWVISNTTLSEFAKLLERRFDLKIKFSDERIKEFVFKGTFKGETIEQILTVISYSAPVKYKISNKQVTLSIESERLNDFNMLLK